MAEYDANGNLIRDSGDVGAPMKAPSAARLALVEEARRTGNYALLGGPEDAAEQDRPQQGDYRAEERQGIERLTPTKKPGDNDPFREARMQPKYGPKRHTRPVMRLVNGVPTLVHEEYTPKPPTLP